MARKMIVKSNFTVEEVMGYLQWLDEEQAQQVVDTIKEMGGEGGGDTYEVLKRLDKIIGGHGVESVRDEFNPYWDSYYTDHVFEYVNTGDTYSPTICYDILNNKFELSTMGDMWEAYERERDEYYMKEAEEKYLNKEISVSLECWEVRRDTDLPMPEGGRECKGGVVFITDNIDWKRDDHGMLQPLLIGRHVCEDCGEEYLETEGLTPDELEKM